MLGMVSRKKYDVLRLELQAALARAEHAERAVKSGEMLLSEVTAAHATRVRVGDSQLNNLQQSLTDALGRAEQAEAACKVAEDNCARVMRAHATRVRVGHFVCDPIALTAKIRAIESSLRCEWDGEKVVCYGDRPLTDSEFNAVVAAMLPQLSRT